MPNLELTPKTHLSSFRKIAIGTWATAYDPSVYGSLEVRMGFQMEVGEKLDVHVRIVLGGCRCFVHESAIVDNAFSPVL